MTVGSTRNTYVDMLRGISILLVMLLHYSLTYRLQFSPLQELASVPTLRAIFLNGNYGVSIFFVISGFLITTNILKRYGSLAGTDVLHFYKLRFFRLYPSVVLALVAITLLGLAGMGSFANVKQGQPLGNGFFLVADLSVLTFWHNILMARVGYFNYAMNIYWSLSVEEVFYLLYPLLLVVFRRAWMLFVLACVAIVVGPYYRGIHSDDEILYLYGNLACVDMLVYGCAAAIAARQVTWTDTRRSVLALLCLVFMGRVYMDGIQGNEAFGATLMGIGAAVFLTAVADLPANRIVGWLGRPLAWLGVHSYELYLFHIVVLGLLREVIPRADMTQPMKLPMLVGFLLVSSLVAWVAARYYGDPLNRWLRGRYASAKGRSSASGQAVAEPGSAT